MQMRFVQDAIPRNEYESDNAELAVVFGRRRLGKTALVKESLEEYDVVGALEEQY